MLEERRDGLDPRLAESEARYRAVIENASDMIQSIRPDGTLEFVNPAWHRTLGYDADDIQRLIIWDVIHPDSLDHCRETFALVMQGQPIENTRVTFLTKDGRAIPAEGSATVRLVDGQVIATHAFFRDITERLLAEELHARNEQLEREQLARHLEKMAALGKLSAGLAHELNNPAAAARRASAELLESLARRDAAARELTNQGLTAGAWQALADVIATRPARAGASDTGDPIAVSAREDAVEDWLAAHGIEEGWSLAPGLVAAGIADAALEELAGQFPPTALGPAVCWLGESLTVRDAAEVVSRSAGRMSDLVSAVKAYSYMDRAAEQVVDVHEGLDNTLVILAHRLRNMTVIAEYDRHLPPVRTHGSGLNQVWTNIIDNAVDATDGRGTLTIRTRRDGDRAVVEIGDDGCGIPPEIRTRIFDPFFTTKPQGKGLGLGLDTAWRIVTEELQGTIEVESAPGRTVFRVALAISG
jgi:PAS domain S-box-containing protein